MTRLSFPFEGKRYQTTIIETEVDVVLSGPATVTEPLISSDCNQVVAPGMIAAWEGQQAPEGWLCWMDLDLIVPTIPSCGSSWRHNASRFPADFWCNPVRRLPILCNECGKNEVSLDLCCRGGQPCREPDLNNNTSILTAPRIAAGAPATLTAGSLKIKTTNLVRAG